MSRASVMGSTLGRSRRQRVSIMRPCGQPPRNVDNSGRNDQDAAAAGVELEPDDEPPEDDPEEAAPDDDFSDDDDDDDDEEDEDELFSDDSLELLEEPSELLPASLFDSLFATVLPAPARLSVR